MGGSIPTQGTKVSIGVGEPGAEVMTPIKGIFALSGPNETVDEYEDTDFDDTAKSFAGALKDSGEVGISVNLKPNDAGQVALRAALGKRALFEILLKDGTKYEFEALVKGRNRDHPAASKVENVFTLHASGEIVETVAPA